MGNVTWDTLDWDALDRLRAIFLSEAGPRGMYWTSRSDLVNYDFTFGRRIAWKWDAVLRELHWRRWTPPADTVLDWGSGSGVASRRVIEAFGPKRFTSLFFHDCSELAMDFAAEAARSAFPRLRVERADANLLTGDAPVGLLVVSHVLGELDDRGREHLLRLARRAEAILWVEPGCFQSSRDLIADFREHLRGEFHILAPCTHQAACGLLARENARHWCHNFADPPAGIMGNANWVRFAKRAGIDLRRLPYSFLALEKPAHAGRGTACRAPTTDSGNPAILSVSDCSRILGEPRHYKGHALVTSCQEDGVYDVTLRKRDAPALFKALKGCGEAPIYRWDLSDGRIIDAQKPGNVSV